MTQTWSGREEQIQEIKAHLITYKPVLHVLTPLEFKNIFYPIPHMQRKEASRQQPCLKEQDGL